MSQAEAETREPADDASGGSFWALMILLFTAGAILVALQRGRSRPAEGAYVGLAIPPIDSGGWLNVQSPLRAEDLAGKVVLMDFWASDCMPCLRHVPELVKFNRQYRDQGLIVVGLSPESGPRADSLKKYVESTEGIDWPIGYDSVLPYQVMDIRGTPTYYLFDRSGRSVWGGHSLDGFEDALVAALARK